MRARGQRLHNRRSVCHCLAADAQLSPGSPGTWLQQHVHCSHSSLTSHGIHFRYEALTRDNRSRVDCVLEAMRTQLPPNAAQFALDSSPSTISGHLSDFRVRKSAIARARGPIATDCGEKSSRHSSAIQNADALATHDTPPLPRCGSSAHRCVPTCCRTAAASSGCAPSLSSRRTLHTHSCLPYNRRHVLIMLHRAGTDGQRIVEVVQGVQHQRARLATRGNSTEHALDIQCEVSLTARPPHLRSRSTCSAYSADGRAPESQRRGHPGQMSSLGGAAVPHMSRRWPPYKHARLVSCTLQAHAA